MSASAHMAHRVAEWAVKTEPGKAAVASTAGLMVVAAPVLAPAVAAAAATVLVGGTVFVGVWKVGKWLLD